MGTAFTGRSCCSVCASTCHDRNRAGGALIVDRHQQTTVEGLYAAGDVVERLNQIAVAKGHAAIAATAIHNRLRGAGSIPEWALAPRAEPGLAHRYHSLVWPTRKSVSRTSRSLSV